MANTYDVGDQVRLSAAFTASGTATDPTAVTFKIKNPAGATTTYVYLTDAALVRDSTGNYHVDFNGTVPGIHFYRFSGTGAVMAAGEASFELSRSEF